MIKSKNAFLAIQNAFKEKITKDLIFSKFTQLSKKMVHFPTLALFGLFQPYKGQEGPKIGCIRVFTFLSPQNWISRQNIYKTPDFHIKISKIHKIIAFAVIFRDFFTHFHPLGD